MLLALGPERWIMGAGGPPFIDRKVFRDIIAQIPTKNGNAYQDVDTIYRDMSRLVVAWMARSTTPEIKKLYHELGGKVFLMLVRCAKRRSIG